MSKTISFVLNGRQRSVQVDDPEMPLLYALRNDLGLHGPRFGCGLAQCGACTVHVDGKPVRSCMFPVAQAAGAKLLTLEGLGTPERPHALQKAFIEEQAVQCGYCINGMIMQAAAFLQTNRRPTDSQIKEALADNLCRCGTHARIVRAVTQIAAEELGVPMQRVKLVTGDTLLTPDQGPTFGSLTIQNGGVQIRQACATAREALLDRAAQKLGVSRSDLAVQDGWIRGNGKRVAYAELVGDRRLELKLDAKAPLKDPSAYTIVGKPVPRLDIPEKVTGRFTYMQDLKVKGMVHARVVRPPAMRATLEDWSDAQCKQIPGYLGAVRKGSFLAVVAHDEWAAIKAMRAIEAGWSKWEGLPDKAKLWDHVRASRVAKDEVLQNAGDSAAALGAAPKLLKATYV